jgi:hypothetical protein
MTMSDGNQQPRELRQDERDPKFEREPQEQARPDSSQRIDDRGRDVNRDGSDSNAS